MHFRCSDGDASLCLCAESDRFVMLSNWESESKIYGKNEWARERETWSNLPTRNLHSVTFYISNEAYHCSKHYFVEWNWNGNQSDNLIEGCQSRKLNGWRWKIGWNALSSFFAHSLVCFRYSDTATHIDWISILFSLLRSFAPSLPPFFSVSFSHKCYLTWPIWNSRCSQHQCVKYITE